MRGSSFRCGVCALVGLFAGFHRAGQSQPLLRGVKLQPSSDQVKALQSLDASSSKVLVSIAPGSDAYPGVNLTPSSGAWNLSKFGHVTARIVNTGSKLLSVSLRVDNAGNWQDNPWDAETAYVAPGQVGEVTTIFGYSYGYKHGFALNPAAVVNLVVFVGKSDGPQSFRIESIDAGGTAGEKPPVAPEDVRTKPPGGVLFGPGAAGAFHAEAFQTAEGFAEGILHALAGQGRASATIRPSRGRWDLSDYTEIRFRIRNIGFSSVSIQADVESNGGGLASATLQKPVKPSEEVVLVVPFGHPVDLTQRSTTGLIASDAVSSVRISVEQSATESKLMVSSIEAKVRTAVLPDWLGKRPPVSGNWVMTLDDEFNGNTLNPAVWKATGENYYDKVSHWSKSDVMLGDGVAKLRYEKKPGFQNDDAKRSQTPYAAGYLDTYGLWTQRYGYFEARMKLPTAPGLWPAFWMMPDRGVAAGPEQWKRQDTANGGMEFDIMEHLSRWGPYRYNIAMHYDGYGKDHKQLGSDKIYVEPDKDGFITCGLLWMPGSAIYYGNGKEILRWIDPRVSTVPSILMFTLPSGGWDNNELDDLKLPADFVIDYVRVWQRKPP